jgi:L,D-transpeptidase-like protein
MRAQRRFESCVMRSFQRLALALFAFVAMSGLAEAMVRIDIDLSTQTMHVASRGGESYDWPISSGRAGHLTPRGRFRPIALYPMVHSLKYDNAPMPHSIFFLSQYAIHATNAVGALGRPASHGCIRLSSANAAALYAMVQSQGAVISIVGATPGREMAAAHHSRRSAAAMAYAPRYNARTLNEWVRDPFEDE